MKSFRWLLLMLLLCSQQVWSQTGSGKLLQAEYFWGADPGAGSGVPMSLNGMADDAVREMIASSAALLPPGWHKLNVRVKDSLDHWGAVFSTIMLIEQPLTGRDISVIAGRAYLDNNIATASPLLMINGNADNAINEFLQLSPFNPLSQPGLHSLHVQLMDPSGQYGAPFKTIFVVDDSVMIRSNKVMSARAWFDGSVGQAVTFLAEDGFFSDAVESVMQSMATPAGGLHVLHVQLSDSLNGWGQEFRTAVFVESPHVYRNINIALAEVYWDNDPGSSQLLVTANGQFTEALEFALSDGLAADKSAGLHSLHVRFKDVAGNWGQPFKMVILLENDITHRAISLSEGEVSIDQMPPITVVAMNGNFSEVLAEAQATLLSANVPVGMHSLNVRFKGADHQWGPYFRTSLVVSPCATSPQPVVTASGPLSFCDGGSVTLSVTAPFSSYQWILNNSIVGTDSQYIASASGEYTVVVTDTTDCPGSSAPVTVIEHIPVVAVAGVSESCSGIVDSLFASGSFTQYQWSTGATTPFTLVSEPGVFTVTVTDSFGCSASAVHTVAPLSSPPVPVIQSNGPLSFCPGNSVTFDCGLSGGFVWSTGSTNPVLHTDTSGVYTVIVTGANGCTSYASVSAVLFPDIQVGVLSNSDGPLCADSSLMLYASEGQSFVWSNGVTTSSVIVQTAGDYQVVAVDSNGCVDTSDVVTVYPLPSVPVVTVNGPLDFCNGGSVTLQSSSATGNIWSNGATQSSVFVTASAILVDTVFNGFGCKAWSSPVEVNVHPVVQINASGPLVFCDGDSVQLTAVSSTPVSYEWFNGSTSASVVVSVSTDSVWVIGNESGSGCRDTASVTVFVNELPSGVISPNGPVEFCQGNSVTLTTSGDPHTIYYWFLNGVQLFSTYYDIHTGQYVPYPISGYSLDVIGGGVYTAQIVDTLTGCSSMTNSIQVIVNAAAKPIVSVAGGSTICLGDSVELLSTDAVSYWWPTGDTTSSVIVNASGFYYVEITDSNGCVNYSDSVLITFHPVASIDASNGWTLCAGEETNLAAFPSGTYLWSDGTITQTLSSVNSPGVYSVTVTDTWGCTSVASGAVVVNPLPTGSVSVTEDTVLCQGESLLISAIGSPHTIFNWYGNGSPLFVNYWPFTTIVEGPAYAAVNTGSYSVSAIDTLTGCSSMSNAVAVSVIPVPEISFVQTADVLCNGSNDASLEVLASGSIAPYTYQWSNGESNASIQNITAGVYVVTVTDVNGCSSDSSFLISQPTPVSPLLMSPVNTRGYHVSCPGSNDGQITVYAGGTAPYQYTWNTGSTSAAISDLTIGTYSVVVTDANGCVDSASITLYEPPVLQIQLSSATYLGGYSIRCNGLKGWIQAAASGGTGPFTYHWSDNQNTALADTLYAGTYTVAATDSEGCVVNGAFTLTEPPALMVIPAVTQYNGYQVSCYGSADGEIATLVNGGVAPYQYSWADTVFTAYRSSLDTGWYSLIVTDTNNCSVQLQEHITGPEEIIVYTSGSHLDCFGDADGVAIVDSIDGGDGPFNILWSDGTSGGVSSGLEAGTYYLTVTDSRGCSGVESATVTQPAQLVGYAFGTYIGCGTQIGLLSGSAIGGTGSYSYLWSNGSTNNYQQNIPVGTYVLTVTDSLGCIDTATTIILNPPVLVGGISETQDTSGTVLTAQISGGVPPYMFLWNTGASTQQLIVGPGHPSAYYSVIVTDANGCTSSGSVFVPGDSCLLSLQLTGTDVTCFGLQNGSVVAGVTNAVGAVHYSWTTDGDTSVSRTSLAPGIYTVVAYDSAGCVDTASVAIQEPAELIAAASIVTPVSCSGGAGEVMVSAIGGVSPYVGIGLFPVLPGNVGFVVTDGNGCIDSVEMNILNPSVLSAELQVVDDTICSGEDGWIDVFGSPMSSVSVSINGILDTVQLDVAGHALVNIIAPDSTVSLWTQSIWDDSCAVSFTADTVTIVVIQPLTWYLDADGDGYTSATPIVSCEWPGANFDTVFVMPGDCDDANAQLHPAMNELCNNIDDNCNGVADEGIVVQTDTISGTVSQCIAMTAGATQLTVPLLPNTLSYNWSVPAGLTIVSGQGTNTIVVNWGAMDIHHGIIGELCVTPTAVCGQAIPRCKPVDLNYTAPVQPNSISGPVRVCPGDQAVYSVAVVARAAAYIWTLPIGMSMVSSPDANVITVLVTPAYNGGQISVAARNTCGTGAARVRNVLLNVPSTPGTIAGPANGVCAAVNVNYSIATVPNAVSYTWMVPAGCSIVSGQGSNSILVSFSSALSTGLISVHGVNGCGSGSDRQLTITGAPAQPGPVSGSNAICPGATGVAYSVATVAGASAYNWTVPAGAVVASGQGNKNITVNFGMNTLLNQSVQVRTSNGCGQSAIRALTGINIAPQFCLRTQNLTSDMINVYPNPTSGFVILEFDNEVPAGLKINVNDMNGREVFVKDEEVIEGKSVYHLDLKHLVNGVYIMKLTTDTSCKVIRLVVEK